MVSSADLEALLMWEQGTDYSGKLTNLCCLSDSLNHTLRNDVIDSDAESPPIFEENPTHKTPGRQPEKFLNFGR